MGGLCRRERKEGVFRPGSGLTHNSAPALSRQAPCPVGHCAGTFRGGSGCSQDNKRLAQSGRKEFVGIKVQPLGAKPGQAGSFRGKKLEAALCLWHHERAGGRGRAGRPCSRATSCGTRGSAGGGGGHLRPGRGSGLEMKVVVGGRMVQTPKVQSVGATSWSPREMSAQERREGKVPLQGGGDARGRKASGDPEPAEERPRGGWCPGSALRRPRRGRPLGQEGAAVGPSPRRTGAGMGGVRRPSP